MPDGGELWIEAYAEDDRVVVAVSDTGTGMVPEVLARACEPFYTTKDVSGSGLGLSMVYGFVKQSGGHIKIDSEIGRGTTVKLYFPRILRREDAIAAPDYGAIVGGTETILVAEDDEQVRATVVEMLSDLGDLLATRRDARTPGQATDAELLAVAVETIVRLLELVRERTLERGGPSGSSVLEDEGSRLAAIGKGVVRRVTAPRVDARAEDLRARIAELEAEVARSRALHLRVAELTDVVTELLMPPRSTDGRVVAKALNTYRNESL